MATGPKVKRHAATRAGGLSSQRSTLKQVHRKLMDRRHAHFCSNRECRIYFDDSCSTPEVNGRCETCRGRRRTWVNHDGVHSHDPAPCCWDNTLLITDTKILERFLLAGPGPWFQCQRCFRAHGSPCSITT